MGFNNGYESGYDDAKAELMPRIKALEAQLASGASSSTSYAPGPGGGTAPGGVQVVEPTIDLPVQYMADVYITPGSASEIISITAEESDDGEKTRVVAIDGISRPSDGDSRWTISSDVWQDGTLQGGGFSYKFKIFWRMAGDPSSVARITETPVTQVYVE